jgi:crooked neck
LRCRTLFEKQIQWNPSNTQAWIKYAELERGLDDLDRARAIFELGIEQPTLDMPELLWKAYIDFEEYEEEYDRTRALYERLLEKTDHVKVWINYARFEINIPEGEEEEEEEEKPVSEEAKRRAKKVFERAHTVMKEKDLKEDVSFSLCLSYRHNNNKKLTFVSVSLVLQRVALLNAWKSFEQTHGSAEDIAAIERQMPRKVKKRRKIDEDRYEEYMDYIFPADDAATANLSKLLQTAYQWKAKRQEEAPSSS